MTLGADIGTLTVKVAENDETITVPAPADGPRAAVQAILAAGGSVDGGLCLAVPEAWLTGDVTGAALQEDLRHECEDVARTGQVVWTGQLAAVAALTARDRGNGRYLVCDIGGTGVRAGVFTVSGGTVEILATSAATGGGWRDFDTAIRVEAPGELPANWHEQASTQEARAVMVFDDAATSPDDIRDARAYRIRGPYGDITLKAGHVIDAFAPAMPALRAVIADVIASFRPAGITPTETTPTMVVLTGGLGWLPLAVRAVEGETAIVPERAAPDAAARGALLFACGEARIAPPADCPDVALPAHRIRDGLLEEVSVPLPWTAPFASPPGGAMTIDAAELRLTVGGQPRAASLPGLTPGRCRAGVRPAWPGPGVLVIRPEAGDSAYVVPLSGLVTP